MDSVPAMLERFRHTRSPEPAETLAGFLAALPPNGASAERAWRVALAAMLTSRHLQHPVDLARVLEMALVSALPGPAEQVRNRLDPDNGLHVHALLLELQTAGTSEARLVQSLGALADGEVPRPRDRFLRRLADRLHDDGFQRVATG